MKTGLSKADLLAQLNPERLPQHIAIIMDGNGRWAKKRRLPRIAGHREGIRVVRKVVEACVGLGVRWLTLYAFSVENWKRPQMEVKLLMSLLREYLKKEIPEMHKHNIRFGVIGRIRDLPDSVQSDVRFAIQSTRKNTGLRLTLALNYGGRAELIDAVREIVGQAHQNGSADVNAIDEEFFSKHLYTRDLPDPDLLIRTSGEMRLSNFLLWQIAYSEIWVTETLWPDFAEKDLYQAIVDFQKRERRYGGLG